MVFDFVYNQKRKVKSFKNPKVDSPSGVCANCGDTTAEVEVQDTYRFCFVPLYRKSQHQQMCSACEWSSSGS